ncbi:hypothetical protein ACEUZ9_004408 [Paracoccus litorisediminis]|jgi:hypothetical protein|uniref:Uncharacterized protein n=1 Tax=Paracoccus litorisediminis TaxID=2006130 RepID=A0A844HSC3_9RHOB|nr:hypothetical protein [Paracoccus litorisediminis]MTH62059.1 hypothetical protein [Paracoccus litorisediminis]
MVQDIATCLQPEMTKAGGRTSRRPDAWAGGMIEPMPISGPLALRRLRSCAKTSKPVRFENTETTRQSLERWISNPEMLGLKFS